MYALKWRTATDIARQLTLGTMDISEGRGMCCDTNLSAETAVCWLLRTPVLRSVSHVAATTSLVDAMQVGCRSM